MTSQKNCWGQCKGVIRMTRVERGSLYFKLDDTVDSQEKLNEFFEKFGFTHKPVNHDKHGFSRQTEFENKHGLKFIIVWFVNLAHIRFGTWQDGHFESDFTSIRGSLVQNCDNATFQFYDGNIATIQFSVPYKNLEV